MSAGLACIISDIPAMREIFGESAMLVNPEDSERLASSILRLLTNENERTILELKGKALVSSMKWENVASKEARFMREAI